MTSRDRAEVEGRRPARLASAFAVGLLAAGCNAPHAKEASKPAAPSKVENPVKEGDLATVKLTPEAEAHLALATGAVERREVGRARTIAGDVLVPPGRLVAVSAPFAGSLEVPEKGTVPVAGMEVKTGQTIFRLKPIASPDKFLFSPNERVQFEATRATKENLVKSAKIALEQAKVALDRAEGLYRDRTGGRGALVDAQLAYNKAKTDLENAEAEYKVYAEFKASLEAADGDIAPLELKAQSDGVLRNVLAQPGQKVGANAPVFEVESLDPIWVKVPVPVGELAAIDTEKEAQVAELSDTRGYATRPGRPVPAPPTADPLALTTDLYYEVANEHGSLRPGQKVAVTLPARGEQQALVVPRAAILRDVLGGEWVYEVVAPHTFARRRVLVDRTAGDLALLVQGPKPGAKVVTDGAAELYGAEFGGLK